MGMTGEVARWAMLSTLSLLMIEPDAEETKASMQISVTVVRPCTVEMAAASATLADGELLHVDCGLTEPTKDEQPFRVQLCDRWNFDAWCRRFRAEHPGFDVRTVRFE